MSLSALWRRGGSAEARFWSKVDKDGPIPPHCPELGPCWVWKAGKTPDGYGRFRPGGRELSQATAHRFSYWLAHGELPDGLLVLHRCDNPSCCNPGHLRIGTNEENAADCAAKGREKEQRGSRHALTKLTESDIVDMRAARIRGEPLQAIAQRYGIRKSTASYIVNGKTWTHVPMPGADALALGAS